MASELNQRMDRSLTDIQRISAGNKLTNSRLNTNEIYVEGKLDKYLAEKMFPQSKILIEGSKENLIDLCNEYPHNFGIVDTDHDFERELIKNIPNISDTGNANCMFAAIAKQPDFKIEMLIGFLLHSQIANDQRLGFHSTLSYEIKENFLIEKLLAFAERLTHLVLFRGYARTHENEEVKYVKKYYWKEIISMDINDINKWVDYESSHHNQYEVFSERFSQNLTESGINDHALEDLIFNAIHFDKKLSYCQIRGVGCHGKCKSLTVKAKLLDFMKNIDWELCIHALSDIVRQYETHKRNLNL
jgi:hypothetical protein